MQVIIKGKNIEVTDALRMHAEDKIKKVTRHFDQIMKIEIELSVAKNRRVSKNQTVEVTLFAKGPAIRAKESSTDMYASIDMVINKLERQIKKYKGKVYASANKNTEKLAELFLKKTKGEKQQAESRIVKTKQFLIKPMTPEEAILQMELLSHDFFVFTNSETEDINVVYRRKDKNYGLIEPTPESS